MVFARRDRGGPGTNLLRIFERNYRLFRGSGEEWRGVIVVWSWSERGRDKKVICFGVV